MRARSLLLSLALLACACNTSRPVLVQRQRGIEGAWHTEGLIVRTKGDSVMIYAETVTIEVQHFPVFRGYLEEDTVVLRGDRFEVRLTPEMFEVGYKMRAPQRWKLAALPKGKVAVFDGFDLVTRDP